MNINVCSNITRVIEYPHSLFDDPARLPLENHFTNSILFKTWWLMANYSQHQGQIQKIIWCCEKGTQRLTNKQSVWVEQRGVWGCCKPPKGVLARSPWKFSIFAPFKCSEEALPALNIMCRVLLWQDEKKTQSTSSFLNMNT